MGRHRVLGLGNAGVKREEGVLRREASISNRVMCPGAKREPEANCRPILKMLKRPRLEFKGFQAEVGGQVLHVRHLLSLMSRALQTRRAK